MAGDSSPVDKDPQLMAAPPFIQKEGFSYDAHEHNTRFPTIGEKSAGIARMEAIAAELTMTKRIIIYSSMFLLGYAYGLDYLVRNSYLAYATSSFQNHSLLSTVNVIRGVVAAAVQPSMGKLADVFGRLEVLCICVAIYTVGSIVETAAKDVQSFAAGAMLYQIGYTSTVLILEIIIADITSVKSRLFFAFIPTLPFIINTWISGNITEAVLTSTSWRWGIGMFCIIYPVCAAPLIATLVILGRQASKKTPREKYPPILKSAKILFWQLDIIGVLLLTGALAMMLIPLTLAGGLSSKWKTANIITPLVIGFLLVPIFAYWETKSPHPLLPYYLLVDRTVWASLGIGCFTAFAFMTHANFLFALLIVSYDFSISTSTRIASVYAFCAVVAGFFLGLVVLKVRRLKPFVLVGVVISFVGIGLLVHYRGGPSAKAGLIAGEVIVGIAGGFFPYPTYVLIQTVSKHEHIGVLIGLIFTMNNVGVALGTCVSGAIWTQTLYQKLTMDLAPFNNATLAPAIYAAPFSVVPEYPIGTPIRDAIIVSYRYIQRLLTITALGLTIPILILALFLRNPKLSNEQVQPETETDAGAQEVSGASERSWTTKFKTVLLS